ncbi:hypothetical protein HRbin08_02004 [bacterium HR08]|nr:hypothetical protein HRbin08_02004 [bacterium HR08]
MANGVHRSTDRRSFDGAPVARARSTPGADVRSGSGFRSRAGVVAAAGDRGAPGADLQRHVGASDGLWRPQCPLARGKRASDDGGGDLGVERIRPLELSRGSARRWRRACACGPAYGPLAARLWHREGVPWGNDEAWAVLPTHRSARVPSRADASVDRRADFRTDCCGVPRMGAESHVRGPLCLRLRVHARGILAHGAIHRGFAVSFNRSDRRRDGVRFDEHLGGPAHAPAGLGASCSGRGVYGEMGAGSSSPLSLRHADARRRFAEPLRLPGKRDGAVSPRVEGGCDVGRSGGGTGCGLGAAPGLLWHRRGLGSRRVASGVLARATGECAFVTARRAPEAQ